MQLIAPTQKKTHHTLKFKITTISFIFLLFNYNQTTFHGKKYTQTNKKTKGYTMKKTDCYFQY